MKTLRLIIIAGFCMSIVGCATIFKGSNADIRVNSSPAGATILANGINKGVTPQTLSLKRNQNYILEFKRDGYEDIKLEVNKKFDIGTTVVGNIVSWALLGIVVDVASGAAYSLDPADLQANLAELRISGHVPDESEIDESDIHVIMLTKEEWEEIKTK